MGGFKRKSKSRGNVRSVRRRLYKRPVSTNLSKAIRRIALRSAETKYRERGAENIQLYHNAGFSSTTDGSVGQALNLLLTAPGTTEHERVGTDIIAVGIKCKLWLSNKSDRPNVLYRIIVYGNNPSTTDSTAADSRTTGLFDPTTGLNTQICNINTKKFTVHYSKILRVRNADYVSGKEISMATSFYIPLKMRRVVFESSSSSVPKDKKDIWHMAIIPYDAYGTLVTDNIASCAMNMRFYYKDP